MDTSSADGGNKILARIYGLIEPFNKKRIDLLEDTSFGSDLDLDSLTVMDLLAAIEDEFDVTVPLNMLPDLDTVGKVAQAVADILEDQ